MAGDPEEIIKKIVEEIKIERLDRDN